MVQSGNKFRGRKQVTKKESVLKKLLSLMIVAALITVPVTAMAQGDACAQAYNDARRDVNGTLWFAMGCLLGVIGLGVAYLVEPSPSATSLVGKSSDYVAVYTDCYKDKGRSVQTRKAFNGCLIWGIFTLLFGGTIALGGCSGVI